MVWIDITKEIVIRKLLDSGIEASDNNIDEVMRYIKFSSVSQDDLDRAIEEYITFRWKS